MTYEEAQALLKKHNQSHLLRFWAKLDKAAQAALLKQVAELDFASIGRMQAMLKVKDAPVAVGEIRPAQVVELDAAARKRAVARGEEELRSGRVGVVLVAGGQGSRLGFEGPKGAYPIGPVTNALLFHFHVRKVLALSRRHCVSIPLYIMVSNANHAATRACFEEQKWFGMKPADVFFFEQGMWPALDADGRIILDAPGHVFQSPDGHGGTLSALVASGALADMEKRGLKTIFYFQVDNPMVEVADPAFLGVHLNEQSDISVKVCAKRNPQEGLGVDLEDTELVVEGRVEGCVGVVLEGEDVLALARLDAGPHLEGALGAVAAEVVVADHAPQQAVVGGGDAVVVVEVDLGEGAHVDLELLLAG